ncbi:MAG: hypothetical protein ACHQ9S_21970 [Candidatus Binatia bacterium]
MKLTLSTITLNEERAVSVAQDKRRVAPNADRRGMSLVRIVITVTEPIIGSVLTRPRALKGILKWR